MSKSRDFATRWGERMLSIYLALPAAVGPGIYPASKGTKQQKPTKMSVGSRARPGREAVNLTAIYEQTV
jgi:hypothetical protein